MKKFLYIIIQISLLFSLTACSGTGSGNAESGSQTKTNIQSTSQPGAVNLKTLSEDYARQMAGGDFSKIVNAFSANLKPKLNSNALKAGWDTTVSKFGKFIEIINSTISTDGKFTTVIVILRYENNGLQLQVVYNSNNEIDGIWIKDYAIKSELVSNNDYEEISIHIGDGEYQLDGILTVPKNTAKPSVAIFVHGSGQSDMDETIGAGNKPFQDMAYGLAEKGIATIRYNKRYYQHPDLAPKKITIHDEVLDDVKNAITFAKACDKINPEKIFIIGHSLGGMLAPKIALDNNEVTGIVSLAGSPRKLEDIILDQNKKALEDKKDISEQDKQIMLAQIEAEINKIKNVTEKDDYDIMNVNSSYWYSLNQINTESILEQLDIPMLILQGAEDFHVYKDVDYAKWQSLLDTRNNVVFRLYENLNHLFMKYNGKKDITEYDIKGNVDDNVINDIAGFIKTY